MVVGLVGAEVTDWAVMRATICGLAADGYAGISPWLTMVRWHTLALSGHRVSRHTAHRLETYFDANGVVRRRFRLPVDRLPV